MADPGLTALSFCAVFLAGLNLVCFYWLEVLSEKSKRRRERKKERETAVKENEIAL